MAQKKSRSPETLVLQKLGGALKNHRKKMGLSQTEIADLAGVSLNFVSQIESGKPTARIGWVIRLLTAMGLQLKLEFGSEQIKIDPSFLETNE